MKVHKTSVMLAVIFFAAGGYLTFQTVDFLKGAKSIDGVIMDMDIHYGKGTSRASISFVEAGQTRSAVVPVNFRQHRVGDRVSVYYNPTKTPAVKLNKLRGIWLFPFGFLAAGLVCLIIGAAIGSRAVPAPGTGMNS